MTAVPVERWQVGDVEITAGMLRALGCEVGVDPGRVVVEPEKIESGRVPITFTGLNRIPILMVGPLLLVALATLLRPMPSAMSGRA